jgi:hypothetical protein
MNRFRPRRLLKLTLIIAGCALFWAWFGPILQAAMLRSAGL